MSPGLKLLLTEKVVRIELEKGELLLTAGMPCHHVYYIVDGFLRCYFIKNGNEVTAWMKMENDIATAVLSYYGKLPNEYYIQALRGSVLYAISESDLEHACELYPEFYKIRVKLMEFYYCEAYQRIHGLLSMNAADRHSHFKEHWPSLYKIIPQRYIASMLGLARETITRRRKQLR
ncbi:CRP-like cAMP-binding protein [Dinghuibacter silviterrae]|uniref:CRP-like cAMP-binding protein n=2 Tax=Dinghuibacter silviterrae TaxID=1539049 RepID=A0A4V3GKV0_9BACT|nr:CRP-like cAMP-binding protein [Dinghuibacter silviterrae]